MNRSVQVMQILVVCVPAQPQLAVLRLWWQEGKHLPVFL
ncbi:Os05g0148000 [Oryza sativa Japonica Group]|uniref:Os05g0148000 protein n=2 Tax=Oryza sativa subsp. japonica TaxID=39947 RepID=Q6ASQ6_ORYSJ|nr:unknown protein [Oryza sativa Japonica Group]KAB8098106.1 hypothetical protein EE612_027098 [Oryza sativa]BAS92268.1 Os05g0148000 [Oryza sativa Japonica Group]